MDVAVPSTVGLVSVVVGDTGTVAVKTGGAGGVLSLSYGMTLEHWEVFPAASVAVAEKMVIASNAAGASMAKLPSAPAVPVAICGPWQPP